MAKRTRGSQRSAPRRPGTRPPTQRPAPARAPARPATDRATSADVAEAVTDDRPASAADDIERAGRRSQARTRARPGGLLAAKAATEYLYVSQDIRRIVFVAALLFGIMFLLWLLIVVMRVVTI